MGEPSQIPELDMDKPCEICGDLGFEDIIRICCQCRITREHAYCMRVVHEGHRDKWLCYECESPNLTSLHECKSANQSPLSRPVPSKQLEDQRTKFNFKRPPQNSKVRYITPEEAMGLESGATRNNSSPSKIPRRDSIGFKSPPPRLTLKLNPQIGPPGFIKNLNVRSSPGNLRDNNLSRFKEKDKPVVQKEHAWKKSPIGMEWSDRNRQTSKSPVDKITEKDKPVVQKEHAWKKSPIGMGWSDRNRQTSKSSVDKITAGKGHIQHFCEETLTAKPVGGLLKTDKERNNSDSRGTSSQVIHCLPVVSPGKGSLRHLSSETLAKPFPSAEVSQPDREINGPLRHISSEALTMPLPSVEVSQPDRERNGVDVCTDAPPEMIDSEGMEVSNIAIKFDKFLPNHPAECATWKGKFEVNGDVPCGSCDGIQAHPPSKVHRKVFEFSKQLPGTLQFELLPRLNKWVDLFEEDVPGGLDIGLYFLPSLRCEQSYASFLEYLSQHDMLLRCSVNHVELLVFSSKHLQDECQRIGQNYLWGVFCCFSNEVGDKTVVSYGAEDMDMEGPPTDETQAIDMDIDMVGGEETGVVDVVVPMPATGARSDPREPEGTTPVATDQIKEFLPFKVKMERWGSTGASPCSTPCLEDLVSFERELQRRFDRFDALMNQRKAAPGVKGENQSER